MSKPLRPLQWIVAKVIRKRVSQGYTERDARENLAETLARGLSLLLAVLAWWLLYQILAGLSMWAFGASAGWFLCLLMFFVMGGAARTYARWSEQILYRHHAE